MTRKIALEEHFLSPGLDEYWLPTVAGIDPAAAKGLFARLTDFGETRLASMDSAGIARSVLSIAGPGVQAERDAGTARRRAAEFERFPRARSCKAPGSLFGLRPSADAGCRRRRWRTGALHGRSQVLRRDDQWSHQWPIPRSSLAVSVLGAGRGARRHDLHPPDRSDPPSPALAGVEGLRRATWEWGFETGSHALRLVFSGLFDRFPRARLALGHLGETLPYLLWRFDSRAKLYGVKLKKKPSDYIKQNIVVTTSGMSSTEPLDCALARSATIA